MSPLGNALATRPRPDLSRLEDNMGRDAKRVYEWRVERLVAAGVGMEMAEEAAADPRFDYRPVLELIEKGCPPDLAVVIAQ